MTPDQEILHAELSHDFLLLCRKRDRMIAHHAESMTAVAQEIDAKRKAMHAITAPPEDIVGKAHARKLAEMHELPDEAQSMKAGA